MSKYVRLAMNLLAVLNVSADINPQPNPPDPQPKVAREHDEYLR